MINILNYVSHIFCCVGAINWGLVAFLRFNLIEFICKYIPFPKLNLVFYAVIAFAGLYSLVIHFLHCKVLHFCKK